MRIDLLSYGRCCTLSSWIPLCADIPAEKMTFLDVVNGRARPFLTVHNRCKADLYLALNPKIGCSIHNPKYESLILNMNI